MDMLSNISTKELEKELKKRRDRDLGRCPTCGGKWSVYMGCSRSWREEPHCFGCRMPVSEAPPSKKVALGRKAKP